MPQLSLDEYSKGLRNVALSRSDDGVLETRLHTDGADFTWRGGSLQELSCLFSQVAQDRDNRCLIITGTGDSFCADMDRRDRLLAGRPMNAFPPSPALPADRCLDPRWSQHHA